MSDSNGSTSVADHFSSPLVEEDHDIRSRLQLKEEQHKDPIYFYFKMRY